jgi:hypothetical protein
MKILDRIERIVRPYAITNVTLYLVIAQAATFLLTLARPETILVMVFDRTLFFHGEWWRMFSIIIMPAFTGFPLFALLTLYFFYFMGTTLENHWGTARYNIYLLVGYIAMLAAGLIVPGIVSNIYWMSSILLAFATLYPEYQILLFFILPVKMKWLGVLAAVGYIIQLASGTNSDRAQVLAGVANYLLFFHSDILDLIRQKKRQMKHQMVQSTLRDLTQPMHTCVLCGVNEKTNPKMEFRYCPLCKGTPCYCIDHIQNHEHH